MTPTATLFDFELRIEGSDIAPDTVDADEALSVLHGFVRALVAVAEEDGLRPKLVFREIAEGSLVYVLASDEAEVRDGVRTLAEGVKGHLDGRLPRAARDWVDTARRFAHRHQGAVVLAAERRGRPVLTIPRDVLAVTPPLVRGETTIYGEVQRVGGATAPKVGLRLDDSRLLACETKRDLARLLGGRLYQRVAVRGAAEWNPEDWTLVAFTVEEILDHEPSPIREGIAALAKAAGPGVWGENPEQEFADWRRDDE